MGRDRARARAVVAWRGRWALETDGRLRVSEAGVECGVIGDALVDEVGGGPGGLACREPNGIDGLLWSEGLVSHDAINDFGEVIVEEAVSRPTRFGTVDK